MGHERETLEAVTKARADATAASNASPEERARVEGALSGALGRLLAIAEAYPDLKANTTFLEFQSALQKVEDELQLSRRYYNGTTRDLNTAVESFPSVVVANMFKFDKAEYFELENDADRAVPTVKF
jgi:LemA protein